MLVFIARSGARSPMRKSQVSQHQTLSPRDGSYDHHHAQTDKNPTTLPEQTASPRALAAIRLRLLRQRSSRHYIDCVAFRKISALIKFKHRFVQTDAF